MGLTVADVIERGREEIFEAGGVARPAWDVQEGTITSGGLTLTLEGRQTYTPPDGIVEWEDTSLEIAEIETVSSTTVTLQTRGYLGSTAAEHADNVKVILDPPYPRYVLLNALKALIGQLYGYGIYQLAYTAALTLSTTAPVELPTGAKGIVSVLYQNGSQWLPLVNGTNYRLFYNYSGANTAPAIQFLSGGLQGAAMRIIYKKDFDTSTFALTTDLETTVGVPSTLAPHLHLGLAGHVLQGRDVPLLEAEHVRPDIQEPQLGSRSAVGRNLWSNFVSGPVQAERSRLLEVNPVTITYTAV